MNARKIALNLTSATILLIALIIGSTIGSLTNNTDAANAEIPHEDTCGTLCAATTVTGGTTDSLSGTATGGNTTR